ncbi:MAG: LPS export ABC transporter permease LptG [Parvibaculum sp.]|uniref:LPS export ABC transporter permease LptG n=1 Tax=Parvibaculum sp. TaxID=2024848 RepID=UPI0025FBB2CA|nr:LPS export ABC transporter permease LptG [Parvibaculum sp.]MCE9651093.1 LPS export ABC transporter permease LptG [Parvibaculum sp.]
MNPINISWTLSGYLGRRFFTAVLMTFGVFLCLIYMIDLVELMRRSSSQSDMSFGVLASMALLNLPTVGGDTLPFAVLFGGMAAFLRFTRNNELVIARASGVSVWQFMFPALAVAFAIGTFIVTVYNPVASTMSARYGQLEAKYLRGQTSLLAVSPNGLWLRQADADGQSVVHALRISELGLKLEDVTIFLYDSGDSFSGRIDAHHATLEDGYWDLRDVWVSRLNDQPRHYDTFRQPTTLTLTKVQESFADPDTISFWDLPRFIDMAEAAGFSAKRYRLHFYDLLATPVLLCTMVLVGAVFSLRTSRLGGLVQLVLGGVFAGFVLYFVSDLSLALGLSGVLPPFLAAWSPAIVAMMLGLAVLFHLEDG